MAAPLTSSEEAQTLQTIEMFEVIAQSNPADYESLEILKEAYHKLARQSDVLSASKRIAQAYVLSGKLSSAILEFESILQVFPEDREVQNALAEIENRATNFPAAPAPAPVEVTAKTAPASAKTKSPEEPAGQEGDDGRQTMRKILVDGKQISPTDFDLYWNSPDGKEPSKQVIEPFLQILADKQVLPLDRSLSLICAKSRLSYLPLEKYDVDVELVRTFPREICLRWCVLPFDRLSKSVLVATANPFNGRAVRDLENFSAQGGGKSRFLWYVASPVELVKILKKTFR
ncbi:MAG: hypothetical protein HYY23_04300 [Verrucomicrobia bacterium]|nr:hypothetical protein [Verrucomicrobiota bacterium]